MKTIVSPSLLCAAGFALAACAQDPAMFGPLRRNADQEMMVALHAPAGRSYRIETSSALPEWQGWMTLASAGTNLQADTASPRLTNRFYRALEVATNTVTGDHLPTAEGDLVIHPINHATFLMTWNGRVIAVDPVGGAARFTGLPRADLVLVTHTHSDHYHVATLTAVKTASALLLVPPAVYQQSSFAALRPGSGVLTNGMSTNVLGLTVQAVPAYNTTSSFHPSGVGVGYLLTVGGKRIYISGDTEDTPEMLALRNIDVAFLAMNQPYTMRVSQAVNAVRNMQPKVVYPYHSNGNPVTDLNAFKQQVTAEVATEVRLRTWY